ncbi:hypothetical protein NT6N_03470 [Oceaniferula spumae]|uniref:Glycosyltransferase n=1 Tax=Oceaniferula spumae TaxID=2979115 RepID=A0AAT9FH59_9BACT
MPPLDPYHKPSQRPKVLHILADVLPGGMETLMLNLIEQQYCEDSSDNAVAVIQMADSDGSLRPQIEQFACFHDLDCDSFFSVQFIRKFRTLLDDFRPDVVHCWSYDSGVVAGFISRFIHNIKVTWSIHSLDLPSRGDYSTLRFFTLKTLVGVASRFVPHRIISCSDLATEAHVKFGYPSEKCLTIDNGIDVERYCPNPVAGQSVRSRLRIPESAPVVGYIGRSHPVKKIEDFFAAAAILMEQHDDVHFLSLGFSVDTLYPAARKAYDALPDPSRMHICGLVSDPENYLPAMTVNTLTSESEALPMVLMESLACGVPCVSTHVGSASRVVGAHGKCVPAGQPELFAAAVSELLSAVKSDPTTWSANARNHCLDQFSIQSTERKYTSAYCGLVGATNPAEKPSRSVNRSKKVIHLVNDVGYGGAQVLLKRLSIGLKEDGFDQTVISVLPLEPIGKLAPEFEKAGIRVLALDVDGPISGVRGLFKLASILRETQPDLLQTWMFHSALIGEISALLSLRKIPTLWSIHHTKLGKESSKLPTRIIHRMLAAISPVLPDSIIYCSKAGLDLHHQSGFDPSKSELIFNGTDTEIYRPNHEAKAALRTELGIPMDAPLIGMAGRYHPQKDFANLLRAFAMVQQVIPDAHLLACGPDVTCDTEALRVLADACPSPEKVHLIGPRRDMVNIYPALTLGALSSCEGEAFPLVLGEAMSCEVPCVATDVGDSALIIGDTGRIVQPRDSKALAAEMILLLKLSPEAFEQLGKNARQRVRDKFALDTYVKAHGSLYRHLLGVQPDPGIPRSMEIPPPKRKAARQARVPKATAEAPAA